MDTDKNEDPTDLSILSTEECELLDHAVASAIDVRIERGREAKAAGAKDEEVLLTLGGTFVDLRYGDTMMINGKVRMRFEPKSGRRARFSIEAPEDVSISLIRPARGV
jgi:hypothetical protein